MLLINYFHVLRKLLISDLKWLRRRKIINIYQQLMGFFEVFIDLAIFLQACKTHKSFPSKVCKVETEFGEPSPRCLRNMSGSFKFPKLKFGVSFFFHIRWMDLKLSQRVSDCFSLTLLSR